MKPNQPCNYLNRGHKSKVNMFGQYPVAILRETTIYNTNKNLVKDDVYTKFGHILSICSQDIE